MSVGVVEYLFGVEELLTDFVLRVRNLRREKKKIDLSVINIDDPTKRPNTTIDHNNNDGYLLALEVADKKHAIVEACSFASHVRFICCVRVSNAKRVRSKSPNLLCKQRLWPAATATRRSDSQL